MGALTIADWTSMLSTLFAAVAAIVATVSVWRNSKTMKEQRAADSVKRYTELALHYPKLATDQKDREQQQREWFTQFILIMLQDILQAYKHDKAWIKFATTQIDIFRKDLKPWMKNDAIDAFGPEVRKLIESSAP